MTSNFKVANFFALQTRNMFVLTGNPISGNLKNDIFILSEDDVRIKINSVEMINSPNDGELIGLTFVDLNENELNFLKSQKKGDTVVVAS